MDGLEKDLELFLQERDAVALNLGRNLLVEDGVLVCLVLRQALTHLLREEFPHLL